MADKTAELYQQAVQRPEYNELINYLTARGVTPQGRKVNTVSEVNDVDDLVYELTHIANQEFNRQAEEQPQGNMAKMNKAWRASSGTGATGATDFRILLDLATREQQARQPKPRGML